jgi:hypothetical protein
MQAALQGIVRALQPTIDNKDFEDLIVPAAATTAASAEGLPSDRVTSGTNALAAYLDTQRYPVTEADERHSLACNVCGALACLRAYWVLCAATDLDHTDAPGLYVAASTFKAQHPDLWGHVSELHAHMPRLLTALQTQVIRFVHWGASLELLQAALNADE